ncbi:MAG: hypothetical protein HGN29_12775 [Asgard group archaeon]|nr:hypothetical protein [Asgard group archaeon]
MYSLQRLKWQLIALRILSITFYPSVKISAAEDYLIVRVVDASFPPLMGVDEKRNYTLFGFTVDYQIENPTQSWITIDFVCAPYPFPRLKTNLVNKTLEVYQAFSVEWVMGQHTFRPGIKKETYNFYFEIWYHLNKSLPLGRYELWFDYTNCSTCPVPVVTEKLIIDVSETTIIYFFEYNNDTRVVSPTQTIEVADFEIPFYVFSLLFLVRAYLKRKRRNRAFKD